MGKERGGIAPSAIGGESLLFMWTESGEEVIPQMIPYFWAMGSIDRDSEHKDPLNLFDFWVCLP